LDWLTQIVHESACPVIVLISAREPVHQREAAGRGAFACIVIATAQGLGEEVDTTLQRFARYHLLHGGLGRGR
jgi:hypothetical protein